MTADRPTGSPPSPPDFVLQAPSGAYLSLNPATKLLVAAVEVEAAFLVGTWTGPVLVLLLVLASAAIAGVLPRLAVIVAVTVPIVASIMLINGFLYPGAVDVIVRIGPLAPSVSGFQFGLQITLRLLAASLALAVAYLATRTDDLLSDLERRGFGRRATYVIGSAIETVPRTVDRAAEIVDAQRSRGLDTEGRWWRRARGIVPLAAPVVFGALTEVEERTMALEARAFSTPGPRTVLRVLPDSTPQRLGRYVLLLALVAMIVGRITGPLAVLP
ncbi:MAG TPA: energy-coupling factor transporter transmembrane component T [Candidatus Limnocylindrales bacterium]